MPPEAFAPNSRAGRPPAPGPVPEHARSRRHRHRRCGANPSRQPLHTCMAHLPGGLCGQFPPRPCERICRWRSPPASVVRPACLSQARKSSLSPPWLPIAGRRSRPAIARLILAAAQDEAGRAQRRGSAMRAPRVGAGIASPAAGSASESTSAASRRRSV